MVKSILSIIPVLPQETTIRLYSSIQLIALFSWIEISSVTSVRYRQTNCFKHKKKRSDNPTVHSPRVSLSLNCHCSCLSNGLSEVYILIQLPAASISQSDVRILAQIH